MNTLTNIEVGVKSRIDDPNLWPHVIRVLEYLKSKGLNVKIDANMPLKGYNYFKLKDEEVSSLDLLIVIGGDGTLLYTLSHLSRNVPPIMTVRWGRYGFLMEIEINEFQYYFEKYLKGEYKIKEASRIIGYYRNTNLPPALNEYLLIANRGGIVKLELYKDNIRVFRMTGDGVIVASTTGSTAYSLSSGGPIIDEDLDVFTVTPLNPIQLYLRPVVLPITSTLKVNILDDTVVHVIVDGVERGFIRKGDTLVLKRYDRIKFIRFKDDYYNRILRRNVM